MPDAHARPRVRDRLLVRIIKQPPVLAAGLTVSQTYLAGLICATDGTKARSARALADVVSFWQALKLFPAASGAVRSVRDARGRRRGLGRGRGRGHTGFGAHFLRTRRALWHLAGRTATIARLRRTVAICLA